MAEDTVDTAVKVFGLQPKYSHSLTSGIKILGGENYRPTLFIKLIQQYGIDRRVALHLVDSYGDRAFNVAKLGAETGNRWPVVGVRLSPLYFFIDAEVRYGVRYEYARTLIDVIARRVPIAFQNANVASDILPNVVKIMAEELHWDESKQIQEIENAKKYLSTMGADSSSEVVQKDFTSLDLVKWRKVFDDLDKNHEGKVDIDSIIQQLSLHFKEINAEKMKTIVLNNSLDKSLEFSHFLEILTSVKHSPEVVYSNFQQKIDVSRSGGGL